MVERGSVGGVGFVAEPAFAEARSAAVLAVASTEVEAGAAVVGDREDGAGVGALAGTGDGPIIGIGLDTIPTAMGTIGRRLTTTIPITTRIIRRPLIRIRTIVI